MPRPKNISYYLSAAQDRQRIINSDSKLRHCSGGYTAFFNRRLSAEAAFRDYNTGISEKFAPGGKGVKDTAVRTVLRQKEESVCILSISVFREALPAATSTDS